jgi:hypothetical protein
MQRLNQWRSLTSDTQQDATVLMYCVSVYRQGRPQEAEKSFLTSMEHADGHFVQRPIKEVREI